MPRKIWQGIVHLKCIRVVIELDACNIFIFTTCKSYLEFRLDTRLVNVFVNGGPLIDGHR